MVYTINIDMSIKDLYGKGKIYKDRTYKDGTYFYLSIAKRNLVNKIAEDICLSTRFLLLSCDDIHSRNKQGLKNDIVKGDTKYPRTMAATLHFLQYHDLRNKVSQ